MQLILRSKQLGTNQGPFSMSHGWRSHPTTWTHCCSWKNRRGKQCRNRWKRWANSGCWGDGKGRRGRSDRRQGSVSRQASCRTHPTLSPASPGSALWLPRPASSSFWERMLTETPESTTVGWSSALPPPTTGLSTPLPTGSFRTVPCSLSPRASRTRTGISLSTLLYIICVPFRYPNYYIKLLNINFPVFLFIFLKKRNWKEERGRRVVEWKLPKREISSSWNAGTWPKGWKSKNQWSDVIIK